MISLAAICLLIPEVGPNRKWVALIVLTAAAVAIFVAYRFRTKDNGWTDPLCDLTVLLIAINLVPQVWHAALCLGLMTALAPSLSLHPRSHLIYSGFAVLLIAGMSAAAVIHEVDNWFLPILGITVTYPSVIFYAHWQVKSASRLRERSDLLASMNQLAGSVAHDFNNTLMGISGHAELALMELPKGHPASNAMESVVDAANRASLLSRQLLAFTGGNQVDRLHADLNAEIQMISVLLTPVVPKGIKIQFKSSLTPAIVEFDRAELQQVLMNVILNAGEAMQGQSDCIRIHLGSPEPGWATVTITDTGSGIAPTNLPNIFDPYFTSKEHGHGLGLATAKGIMQKHGGRISLVSTLNQGTEVTLDLPLSTDKHAPSDSTATPVLTQSYNALVVDDELGVLNVTSNYLQRIGYAVTQAINTEEALALFRAKPEQFDIVILDLNMPGRGGWECLRDMRSIKPEQAAVICSGFDPSQEASAEFPGTIAYLAKPFRLAELRKAIRTAATNAKERLTD